LRTKYQFPIHGARTSPTLPLYVKAPASANCFATPSLSLSQTTVRGQTFADPPNSTQFGGDFPLGQCINDTSTVTPYGTTGCWTVFFAAEPAHNEVLSPVATNDSRMHDVWYANGKLYAALTSGVSVKGSAQAGIAYWVLDTEAEDGGVKARIESQGMLALAGNDLFFPAIAPLDNGGGAIGFTVNGADHFPSAGYALLHDGSAGHVHIAAEGKGPQDGFSGYNAFGSPPRPRWGDYGAAAPDGNTVWLAAEYIAQTCTLQQYLTVPIGSCGGTRTSLANWATRITQVLP